MNPQEVKIETKAKYLATLILQSTSLADLFLRDYSHEVNKLHQSVNGSAKFRVKNNLELAKKLSNSISSIECDLNKKINDKQEDHFLDDVGFLYKLIVLVYSQVGDSDLRRSKVLKLIENAYKDKKIEL